MSVELKDASSRFEVPLDAVGRSAEQHQCVGEADDELARLRVCCAVPGATGLSFVSEPTAKLFVHAEQNPHVNFLLLTLAALAADPAGVLA